MRSAWKGIFIYKKLFSKTNTIKQLIMKNPNQVGYFKNIFNAVILSNFVGMLFKIHDGKKFVDLRIKENMVGYKFGDFIERKKTPIYFNKKKNKKKKR